MQLNIADDYFQARKQLAVLEEELQAKEKELYDLKHELVASQMKLENAEKSLKSVPEGAGGQLPEDRPPGNRAGG